MKYMINSGIYSVNFEGTNNAEFKGVHPALILRSVKNYDMYYVIPLTSYTKERWKNYRKSLCCRIISIGSIARIDKMLILHKDKISKRWFEEEHLLVPTLNEIKTVYNRVLEYISLSMNKSIGEYSKFYSNYETLYCDFTSFITNPTSDMLNLFSINIRDDIIYITYSLTRVTNLSFEDIRRIVWSIIGRENVNVTYDKIKNILIIQIDKNNKKLLTLTEWYDTMNLTEEHK